MFTWICPKCGKEVPPSYSDCPNCDVKEQAAQEQTASPQAAPQQAGPPEAVTPPPAPPPVVRARPQRRRVPAWLLTVVSAVVFVGVGVAAFMLFRAPREEPAQAAQAAPAFETPAVQQAAAQTNPVFRHVELTGLRLTEEKRRVFLQFVLVNHSAMDLGDLSSKVDLKSIKAGPADPPVGTFEFKTSLGPYEAKNLKVPVDTKLRAYELPDWQFLRAEIRGQ